MIPQKYEATKGNSVLKVYMVKSVRLDKREDKWMVE